jgi:hypothetical protein
MQSIIPVWSEVMTSVDESTTGLKPAALQALTLPGSPSQAKTLAPAASAGVLNGFVQKSFSAPMAPQVRGT